MRNKISFLFLILGISLVIASLTSMGAARALLTDSVSGMVIDSSGPVSGAIVRVRATENYTTTAADGQFNLVISGAPQEIEVTAWAEGYYVASSLVTPPASGVTITLRSYHTVDNPDYEWASPIPGTSDSACGDCHPIVLSEWEQNAHGGAVSNERFYSLYNGTDVSGTTEVAPGYQNDFPGTSGSCANCHAPGASIDGYMTTDMNTVRDDLTSGIHCDFCHKVGGDYLDPVTNSVYANTPGVQSFQILRPPPDDNIFFGPFDDIPDPDTYLPLFSQSQFCAACHQFSFWNTPIYESYDEWLASPYADNGVTCQDCHMPPNGESFFADPDQGGLEHPPEVIPSHFQLGATSSDLLQNTVEMNVSTQQYRNQLVVSVSVTNSGAGHHVPTDFPGRQMILTVSAADAQNQPMKLVSGPTIPQWGGDDANSPGIAFAKVLKDVESGEYPVVSYWKQTEIMSDNRIPALGTHESTYVFSIPRGGGEAEINVSLMLRRVFQTLGDEKGWDMPDLQMEDKTLSINMSYQPIIFVPLIFQ